MRSVVLPALVVLAAACAQNPWLPVLDGMRSAQVTTELSSEHHDFAAKAPEGFTKDPDNRWILFIFDPKARPDIQQSFERLSADCFFGEIPSDDEEEPARFGAICAFERVPPIPEEEQGKPVVTE